MRMCVKFKCRNEVQVPVAGKGPGALTSPLRQTFYFMDKETKAQRAACARPHHGGISEDFFCCKYKKKRQGYLTGSSNKPAAAFAAALSSASRYFHWPKTR